MPISVPMIFDAVSHKTGKGFSFIELMVVLVLMSSVMAMTVPRFDGFFEKPQEKEYRNLARVLKLLRNEAILGQTEYYMIFDTKQQRYHIEKALKDGNRESMDSPKILKPHAFVVEFPLHQVTLAQVANQNTASRILQFPVEVSIDSSGFVTPFTLVFTDTETNHFWYINTKNIMGYLELKEETTELF
ncbi:type II secretion system protein [Deltaproteobacteria bacterium TL4]